MQLIMVLALSLFQGVLSSDTFDEQDPHEICSLPLDKIPIPAIKSDLKTFCPTMKDFYKCYNRNKVHLLENGWDPLFNFIASMQDIVKELCDHSTRFHRDYFRSVSCFMKMEDDVYACTQKTTDLYKRYRQLIQDEDSIGKDEHSRSLYNCLAILSRMMCLYSKIEKKCGSVELKTFVEIMERTGYFQMYCSEKDMSEAEEIVMLVSNIVKTEKPDQFTIKFLTDLLEVQDLCPFQS